jgi:hypothetical protein
MCARNALALAQKDLHAHPRQSLTKRDCASEEKPIFIENQRVRGADAF